MSKIARDIVKVEGLTEKPLVFSCETPEEVWRAETMKTKEEGTVAWLKDRCKPGCTFLDVGANVGCYTVLAAALGARVIAVEPHVPTAVALMRNVEKNGLTDLVTVLTCALGEKEGFFPFNYTSRSAGSSGHQLGHVKGEDGKEFKPALTETKWTTTIAELCHEIAVAVYGPKDVLVKIDVDGNELAILKGAAIVFRNTTPQSIQVEVHPKDADEIANLMRDYGYWMTSHHHTALGKEKIKQGVPEKEVTRNVIFEEIDLKKAVEKYPTGKPEKPAKGKNRKRA